MSDQIKQEWREIPCVKAGHKITACKDMPKHLRREMEKIAKSSVPGLDLALVEVHFCVTCQNIILGCKNTNTN